MPRNNGRVRKLERKESLRLRTIEINESGLTVAQRESARGFDKKLRAKAGTNA